MSDILPGHLGIHRAVSARINIKKQAQDGSHWAQQSGAIRIARSRAVHPNQLALTLDTISDHYDFTCSACDERIVVSGKEASCG